MTKWNCIWDKELPEVVEALFEHIESLSNRYANDANLDPMEGANLTFSGESERYHSKLESMAELQTPRGAGVQ